MSWLRAIDWFIPDRVRAGGPDAVRRARLAVGSAGGAVVLFLWGAGFRFATGMPEVGAGAAALALLSAGVPFLLRATGSLGLVAHGLPFLLSAFALSVTAATGGRAMGAIFVAGLVPLAAVLLGGLRSGVAWSAVTCVGLAAVGVAAARGVDFPLEPTVTVGPAARFGAAIVLTLGTFGVGVIYESLHQRALRDVSQAHERADAAQERRRESEARFRTLTENASDIITEWDATGFIHYVNAQTARLTGDPPETFVGSHWLEHVDRIHPDDVEGFRLAMERVVTGDVETDVALRFRHADGSWRWFEVTLRPFRTADGERRMVSVGRDVTDRREVETLRSLTQQLEETAAELARTNRELGEFTSVASHDLQEPLRKLVAFSELLRDDLGRDLPEDAERDLRFIRAGAERMRSLVQDLLALSRTGMSAMKPERIAADACVDGALEVLALRVEESGAEIARDPLPELRADPTLLTEIFQNLIGNALKFRAEEAPRIRITAERRGGRWTLGVCDNGVGLAAEQSEEIFKPFRRLHPAGGDEGSGIGLAICRKAVERHGGRIWVESEPGRGAHFRFTLGE